MLAAVKDVLRHRPLTGLAASLLLHTLVLALIFAGGLPAAQYTVKRGEPIMIELPELPDSPPPGPRPVPSSPPPAKASAPRPPAKSAAPAPRPPEPAKPAVTAKPTPPAPEAPLVASRTEPPRPTPEPERQPAGPATTPPPPALSAPEPAAPPAPPRVAAIPPKRDDTVDIRSALRRGASGGAGGHGEARGGIEGEPIPLDSPDPKYSDYLDHIRRKIKSKWGYPCVKDAETGACEYKTAQLVIEFGIAKDGQVRFVNVVRASGWDIYDDWAVNAIKLSSPFLPVPDALGKGAGIPILATFNYVVTTSITNLLH
jgi:outer membrane biosynthesis protein TonB